MSTEKARRWIANTKKSGFDDLWLPLEEYEALVDIADAVVVHTSVGESGCMICKAAAAVAQPLEHAPDCPRGKFEEVVGRWVN